MSFLLVLACLSPLPVEVLVDDDLDGFFADEDCDDNDPSVFPSAEEICDGLDNDCDGEIDEDGLTRFYPDADNDGYGEAGSVGEEDCGIEPNRATNDEDCDDANSLVNPLADEVCDGVDNNCDGTIDEPEAIDALDWFPDEDADGYGDPLEGQRTCDPEPDWVQDDQDCDDLNPEVNPSADEVCNGLDDDCDGGVDLDAIDALSWYADTDSDGYGDPEALQLSCSQPSAYVSDDTDCDDATASTYPGAEETTADGVDSDCDGEELCYTDKDSDTWGKDKLTASTDLSCSSENLATRNGDCRDGDPDTFPGAAPNDSTTSCMTDLDGDDYGDANPKSEVTVGTDCDDDDASIHSAATEITGDSVDQDCDGTEVCYVDSDGDSQGSTSTVVSTDSDCEDSGEAENTDDCNDGDSSVYLGATETVGDEVDSDCDGGEICYTDSDSDGYGSTVTLSSTDSDCSDSGESTNDEDCDDSEALANPGETEICDDGIDNDCSGEFEDCGPYGTLSLGDGDVILTSNTSDASAGSVLTSGDFDGDGQEDLWISAPTAETNYYEGAAYLHLGPITTSTTIETTASTTFTSQDTYAYLGYRMRSGDLDHDGKDDLLISSLDSPSRSYDYGDGNVYMVSGPLTSTGRPDDSGNYDWWSYGGSDDYFGWDLAIGDLDDDGFDDLVVGSIVDEANGYQSGTSFLFIGPLSGGASRADNIDDEAWTGDYGDRAGSANAIGDVNGDGVDDWAIGAPRDSSSDGVVYVLFGPVTTSGALSSSADVTLDGASSERAGSSLFIADLNGDGTQDLIVGGPRYSSNTGRVYVVDGPVTSGGTLSSQASSTLTGASSGDYTGSILHGGCDINNDGMDELLIGAPEDGSSGSAYVLLGGFTAGALSLSTDADSVVNGSSGSETGTAVYCLPDQDGDGNDEIAVGAPAGGSSAGQVSIFFGGGE
jgi:hypothetical protein